MKTINVGSHKINVTHPDRVLFPESGITKGELLDYYHRIAVEMVPLIKGRPVNMFRLHGSIQDGYYQQKIPSRAPEWVNRARLKKEGGTVNHLVCDNAATLVYLANLNCVTPHTWLSCIIAPDKPDQMIFDLDPPGDNFEPVRLGARLLKSIIDEIGLRSYLKTTGSRGLHVVIPLDRTTDFETVRSFARKVAAIMILREPEKYSTEQRKDKRKGRVFIDTLRNAYAHTAVAPYAVRAREGAPVAVPLLWEELDDRNLTSAWYNIRNLFQHLENTGNVWKNMYRRPASLNPCIERLEAILQEDRS